MLLPAVLPAAPDTPRIAAEYPSKEVEGEFEAELIRGTMDRAVRGKGNCKGGAESLSSLGCIWS